jgi:hypothetical protein
MGLVELRMDLCVLGAGVRSIDTDSLSVDFVPYDAAVKMDESQERVADYPWED